MVSKFWDEITLPGYEKIVAEIKPGKPVENIRAASKFFRDKGVQSRPIQCHGIDLVTDKPHVFAEHVSARAVRAGVQARHDHHGRAEPDLAPTAMFGIFLGHTFIVTDKGHEVVDDFPLEIAVSQC